MNVIKNDNFKRIMVLIISFSLIYLILITSLVTKKYNLKEGDIAKINVKAQREVENKIATLAKLNKSVSDISDYYSKKNEVSTQVNEDIDSFFVKAGTVKEASLKDKNITAADSIKAIKKISNINLSEENYNSIMSLSSEELKSTSYLLYTVINSLYKNINIAENSETDIKKAQEFINNLINESVVGKNIKNIAIVVASQEIKPNFFKDVTKTEELKNEAKRKNEPIMIKKDQIVVKEGEPVTKEQIEILKSLQLLNEDSKFEWYIYISLALFIFIIMSIQMMYLYRQWNCVFNDTRRLLMINIITIISLILARSLSIYAFFIPLACAPMLMTLLVNDKISVVINTLNSLLIGVAVSFNLEIIIIAIVSSIIGATILKKLQQRNDIIYSSAYIATISAVLTLSAGFLLSSSLATVMQKTGAAFVGGIISGILTIGLLPFFESSFDVVTTIKLLELSNPNNSLLKKLLMEAPGTYHHSILVGNLAEVAAEEIGGNPVLARVASYYHDIGKIKRPYFFKENQMGIESPHKKITANLSTLIITSHVTDGVELAKEYRLPRVIQDIIEQHHGTSLVKYFFITVKNSSENPELINEEDFRYGGPKPETKEAAIIMLADGVEAAVRSISEPTKAKMEEMVNSIIKDRLEEGELDNCDLTLKEINKIKKSFMKALSGIYHERIEYPKEKYNNDTYKQ